MPHTATFHAEPRDGSSVGFLCALYLLYAPAIALMALLTSTPTERPACVITTVVVIGTCLPIGLLCAWIRRRY